MIASKDNFSRVLQRPHLVYSESTTLDLLTHLYATYTVITNTDYLTNNKCFCKAYAPTSPIEVVWQQIYDSVMYTNSGATPYSSKQVIDNAYQLILNSNNWAAGDKPSPISKCFLPYLTGGGASCFKTRRVLPMEWRTRLAQKRTMGASTKTRWMPLQI